MKQYILIALAIAAGRYVDVPLWQVVLTAAGAIWAVKQLNKDWEKTDEKKNNRCIN